MLYNSNTLFQKMPDKVSFFYAQMAEKWLELSLKKFHSYIFRNNVESETVLYLTNGRKSVWDKIVLSHKKARGSQLWNSSFLILSHSLIVF